MTNQDRQILHERVSSFARAELVRLGARLARRDGRRRRRIPGPAERAPRELARAA
jgi:hypothetical protein